VKDMLVKDKHAKDALAKPGSKILWMSSSKKCVG